MEGYAAVIAEHYVVEKFVTRTYQCY